MAETFEATGEIIFNDGISTSSEKFPKIKKVDFLILYPIKTSVILDEGVYGKSEMGNYKCKIEERDKAVFVSCKPVKVEVFE